MKSPFLSLVAVAAIGACAPAKTTTTQPPVAAKDTTPTTGPGGQSIPNADPFPSTYVRTASAYLPRHHLGI